MLGEAALEDLSFREALTKRYTRDMAEQVHQRAIEKGYVVVVGHDEDGGELIGRGPNYDQWAEDDWLDDNDGEDI